MCNALVLRFLPLTATLRPSWAPYPLHAALLHSIHKRGFEQPTEIQVRTLEVFLKGENFQQAGEDVEGKPEGPYLDVRERDIVGIAQTVGLYKYFIFSSHLMYTFIQGSGKTLAYGLPILHHILSSLSSNSSTTTSIVNVRPPVANQRRGLRALILAPTRELALQVSEHLNACLDQLFEAQSRGQVADDPGTDKPDVSRHKPPPPVSVAAIVGGMSSQKQRRILSRGVDVLVVTPGRFWDLCGEVIDSFITFILCHLEICYYVPGPVHADTFHLGSFP